MHSVIYEQRIPKKHKDPLCLNLLHLCPQNFIALIYVHLPDKWEK